MPAERSRPWHAFYPPHAPHEIVAPPFRHLADLPRASARTYGDRTAFTTVMPNGMFGDLSFADVDRMSDSFAVYLREVAGLKEGDRVALQAPNGLAVPVVVFGVFKAGCVLVNVNPLYTAEEMRRQFADAEPKALVIIDLFAGKLTEALKARRSPTSLLHARRSSCRLWCAG